MARIDGASKQLAGYEALLKVAREHGMEYETDRLGRDCDEMAGELDEAIEAAMEAGFAPEDFE